MLFNMVRIVLLLVHYFAFVLNVVGNLISHSIVSFNDVRRHGVMDCKMRTSEFIFSWLAFFELVVN